MKKGIYLRDAGVVVLVILVVGLFNWIHTVTGGDRRGDTVTVRPAEEKK